jgi:hypothetical protein
MGVCRRHLVTTDVRWADKSDGLRVEHGAANGWTLHALEGARGRQRELRSDEAKILMLTVDHSRIWPQ